MTPNRLSQRSRLIALAVYIGTLFLITRIAFGSWAPPTDHRGLWFYSGLAALLLGNLLVTPYFSKPVDTVSYTVAALVGLLPFRNFTPAPEDQAVASTLWIALVVWLCVMLGASILAITLRTATSPVATNVSATLYELSNRFGTPRIVFSAVFLYAIMLFHRRDSREVVPLTIGWIVLVGLAPIETFMGFWRRISGIWGRGSGAKVVAQIIGREIPHVLLVKAVAEKLSFGEAVIAAGCSGDVVLGVCLDQYGFSEGAWQRVYELCPASREWAPFDMDRVLGGEVFRPGIGVSEVLCRQAIWNDRDRLIGIVSVSTSLHKLHIEVLRDKMGLEAGCIVQAQVRDRHVLFQVLDGLTTEEIVQQKNTRGYVRAIARTLGSWNCQTEMLEQVKWIPSPNVPVFLQQSVEADYDAKFIGQLPGTAYGLSVDPAQLVTHNAAILGILGSGKTFLALELIERMLLSGIKVVCLDLTNQYAQQLTPYFDQAELAAEIAGLKAIGQQGRTQVRQNVEEGGSVKEFRERLTALMDVFLAPKQTERRIKIYNPSQFEVWRQDSKPFQGNASMASLTPVEITRTITEVCLDVVQRLGMTDQARCCLAYEEAHSLVPEWNATAAEVDRAACNGTAKAILQGRKYGLGCLAITQRTANITKSILNQCNTVFALRTFDATGIDFLKNYVGDDYADILSTLEERHAVVFGRACSMKEPVVIRLNDRAHFVASARANVEMPA